MMAIGKMIVTTITIPKCLCALYGVNVQEYDVSKRDISAMCHEMPFMPCRVYQVFIGHVILSGVKAGCI